MADEKAADNKRYAFVGSRNYPRAAYGYIQKVVSQLPSNATVVSGGATGVDSIAVYYAKQRGLCTEVISARVNGDFDSFRAFQRNNEIVESSGTVFAFWDGESNGTRHAISVGTKSQKDVTVVLPSGVSFAPANVLNISSGSIYYAQGDILQANTEAVVNPCNTVGVYGAGLSKALSEKWSWWSSEYKEACRAGAVDIGKLFVTRPPEDKQEDPAIVHFPTKDHWRDPSQIQYIEKGLEYFADHYQEWGIKSIAMPKLGCGLGGLRWGLVRLHIEEALSEMDGIEIVVYV